MEVHRSAADITVLAPAKLNLYFEVLAKRLDGFHEIETLMVPLGLYDVLRFRPDDSGAVSLDCRWADDACAATGTFQFRPIPPPSHPHHPILRSLDSLAANPPERENLARGRLELLRLRSGVTAGTRVELIKRIPAAAGLGGGSSDAAAALIAGNLGWELNWPAARLAELAAELGSDVPFFLQTGAAVCRGRGEQVSSVGRLGALNFVIIRPDAGLSTAQVYARCRPGVSVGTDGLVQALRRGDLRAAAQRFGNRLEPAAEQLSPWPRRLRNEFARLDCVVAQMSGSGSSYFGLCRHARQARRLARRLAARRLGRVFAVRT